MPSSAVRFFLAVFPSLLERFTVGERTLPTRSVSEVLTEASLTLRVRIPGDCEPLELGMKGPAGMRAPLDFGRFCRDCYFTRRTGQEDSRPTL